MTRCFPRLRRLAPALYWWALFAGVWLIVSGADGWAFGLVCSLLATWVALGLRLQPLYLRFHYLPNFIGFFAYEVAVGAWDVARRALHPRVPLNSALLLYPLRCGDTRVRLMLSAMVGLLPGTWASHFDDQYLHLHVLDQQQSWFESVANMERHLARLLGASVE